MKGCRGPGTYILVIWLPQDASINIGALGEQHFGAGFYLYVGSALGGLRGRLARHLRQEKKLRWHIDYLLRKASLQEVWCLSGKARLECAVAQLLGQIPGFQPSLMPFGASDCSCFTHLFYAATKPSFEKVSAFLARKLAAKGSWEKWVL
ncbi:MAG: GIY-YIG nuclease family protein [Anaerolineae bacterium]|nr:GIY-YIG nuclease family protein [Anaerolineae bacterium]